MRIVTHVIIVTKISLRRPSWDTQPQGVSGVSDEDATSAGAFCWSRVGNSPLLVATPTEHVLGMEVLSGVVHVDGSDISLIYY